MTDKKQRKQRNGKKREGVVFPIAESLNNLPQAYSSFLVEVLALISKRRQQAIMRVNVEQNLLYWQLGHHIAQKQQQEGWGAKVIDRLSYDMKEKFPMLKGFSPRNLKYMVKFSQVWPDLEFVQRSVAQLPWGSNCVLLDKVKSQDALLWYAKQALEQGWGRDMLAFRIDSNEFERTGKSINNFPVALPPNDSDMAAQSFKDPYLFDFIGMDIPRRETELEHRLLAHLEHFLLELGQGFAFVGRQVHLELGDQDFYVDLLFYHLKMRCYVVVELKNSKFKPEHISQLNLYQTVIDQHMRHENDNATIGLLLVKDKNDLVVEYSLADFNKPVSVARWEQQIKQALPQEIESNLPSIEDLEKEINFLIGNDKND